MEASLQAQLSPANHRSDTRHMNWYRRTRSNLGNAPVCERVTRHTSCPSRTMALARATKGILLIAFLAAFSAMSIATSLTRRPRYERVAPEAWSALERHDAERAASLFSQELKQRPRDPVLHFG